VNEEPIALVDERENPSQDWWTRSNDLPKIIHCFEKFEDVDVDKFAAILWVTRRDLPENIWDTLHEKLVVYRP